MKLVHKLLPLAAAVMIAVNVLARRKEQVSSAAAKIRGIRAGRGKEFEIHAAVSSAVIKDFQKRGRFYHDGIASYIFFEDLRQLVRLQRGNEPLEIALAAYGLAPTEKVTRQVVEMLRVEARRNGKHTTIHQLSYYDSVNNVLYVSDFDSAMYRIDVDGVQYVDNGTDGVLFLQSPNRQPFSLGEGAVRADGAWRTWITGGVRFVPGKLTVEQQQALVILWVLALFFGMPTKAILAAIAEKGAGKSSLLRRVGQFLFGPAFDVMPLTSKSDDFDAAITNEPLVVADNVDDPPEWFNDRLASAATGGRLRRRELYTTNSLREFPITANIAVTSRTPKFTRDDVADRIVPVDLARIEGGFCSEAEMLADVASRRNELWASLLGDLHQIVLALGATKDRTYRTHLRMADFGQFILRLGDAHGQTEEAEALIDGLAEQQIAFANEAGDDPLFRLLDVWVRQDTPVRNLDRAVDTDTLANELNAIAEQQKERWTPRNGRSLAQVLHLCQGTLETRYGASFRDGHARKRFWTFTSLAGEKGES